MQAQFRAYLGCGILAHGFARARCSGCGHDFLVAFSCKGQGICPSCNSRRMATTAAHLTDYVIPAIPVRQWVLSVPKRLRYFLHRDPKAAGAVLHILLRALRRTLRNCSPGAGPEARIGAVSFLHRFHEATALTRADVEALQETVRRRILRWFGRQGLLEEHTVREMLGWDHAGGFSLDASVRIAAHDRAGLGRLLRYCARPLVCPECGESMRLIAFLTDPFSIRAVLDHLGEPVRPPAVHPARGPPELDFGFAEPSADEMDQTPAVDPAEPEPIPLYEMDQTRPW